MVDINLYIYCQNKVFYTVSTKEGICKIKKLVLFSDIEI